MSNGDGPPPYFDGDDFPYWKIRMEAYLEAIDVGVFRAASQGFPKPKDPANLEGDEVHYEKWNAKAKNTIFRGLCKEVFNRVRNHKDAHALWSDICALHEGTKSEREERYHLVMRKLNSFEMLEKESANDMYSRLNILVEELNGLGLTQMQPSDVVRKILCVLPIEKYGHIVTVLHQGDLSTTTPTQILGKINAHEMYMHITPQDGSSSSKKKEEKKDLAFKASHERRCIAKIDSSSDDDSDDTNIALMVRKTTKMLKKLNKKGVKFDSSKKKFFTSSKRKPISEMDCYNCGELGHLAHQCPKPKKDKNKKKFKGKKDDSSDDEEEEKKKYKPNKKFGKKKEFHKKKNGKAYITGDWLTDIEESSGSSDDDDDEKVAAFGIGSSLSSPPPLPSSSTHLCLMAKGDRKVLSDDSDSDSDSDGEFEPPSYDELVNLLNKYTKIIRKTKAKNDKLELENETLLAKYDIAQKASDELRDENKVVSSTLKELKNSLKELIEKHDKLEKIHNELNTRYNLLKEEYTNLKINHENLVVAYELLSNEPHDATNPIVKIDIATSCDDLIVENIEQGSSSKGKEVVVADHYDDYVKIKEENEKLKK